VGDEGRPGLSSGTALVSRDGSLSVPFAAPPQPPPPLAANTAAAPVAVSASWRMHPPAPPRAPVQEEPTVSLSMPRGAAAAPKAKAQPVPMKKPAYVMRGGGASGGTLVRVRAWGGWRMAADACNTAVSSRPVPLWAHERKAVAKEEEEEEEDEEEREVGAARVITVRYGGATAQIDVGDYDRWEALLDALSDELGVRVAALRRVRDAALVQALQDLVSGDVLVAVTLDGLAESETEAVA
jgi:hypothetical protein